MKIMITLNFTNSVELTEILKTRITSIDTYLQRNIVVGSTETLKNITERDLLNTPRIKSSILHDKIENGVVHVAQYLQNGTNDSCVSVFSRNIPDVVYGVLWELNNKIVTEIISGSSGGLYHVYGPSYINKLIQKEFIFQCFNEEFKIIFFDTDEASFTSNINPSNITSADSDFTFVVDISFDVDINERNPLQEIDNAINQYLVEQNKAGNTTNVPLTVFCNEFTKDYIEDGDLVSKYKYCGIVINLIVCPEDQYDDYEIDIQDGIAPVFP